MALQDQVTSDFSQYFCSRPLLETDASANLRRLCRELTRGSLESQGGPGPFIRTGQEQPGVKTCSSQSFARDARMRLDYLKSGCNVDAPALKMGCQNQAQDRETQEASVLDLVEVLEVQDDGGGDEERWLYESPKKKREPADPEPALRWCRRVLDNPSPQTEAACRLLINKLDQRSRGGCDFRASAGRRQDVFRNPAFPACRRSSGHEPSISDDSGFRLKDITDVHVMARIQEDSLRQDYVSAPVSSSPRRTTETQTAVKSGRQSPQLSRLHQQVTRFKLLKLAQDQVRTRSPLQTSLRSLQAVRNSRSLDVDDWQPAGGGGGGGGGLPLPLRPLRPPPGGSCSSSSPAASPAMKRLQRSHSLSPARIPAAAKTHLSVHGRVYASPERPAAAAWGRRVAPGHRLAA